MREKEFTRHIQVIRQQTEALHRHIMSPPTQQQQMAAAMEEITASLENLQLLQEEMQASFEAMEVTEEELLQQHESLAESCQRYCELFELAPDACLLTNAQGVILEANLAAAALFNVLQKFLVGKPLVNFVPQAERAIFRSKLNQLSQVEAVQEWEMPMCPRGGQSFDASLLVVPVLDASGSLVSVRLGVRDVTKYKQGRQAATPGKIPHSLDGLQVLLVDDEADARELITTILESHGICVTAVASVAAALETLERFRPDVLVSDIRMPNEDGYSLIRKLRALEAEQGWHIPAAAFTAYLAEDRAKALSAGFESHLHKLAEPAELVETVARLAGRATTSRSDSPSRAWFLREFRHRRSGSPVDF